MTIEERLNDFLSDLEDSTLPASARLTYLTLLAVHNRFGNQGFVVISDRRLMQLTQLSSPNTIQDSKRRLKAMGLIDFESNSKTPRKGTRYTFPTVAKTVANTVAKTVAKGVAKTVAKSADVVVPINAHAHVDHYDDLSNSRGYRKHTGNPNIKDYLTTTTTTPPYNPPLRRASGLAGGDRGRP